MNRAVFKIKNMRRVEIIADFLIKFNLLAVPMYLILYADVTFYPLQLFLTDIVYWTVSSMGYPVSRNGIAITLLPPASPFEQTSIETIVMSFDCTAWKTMYAFAALVVASPVVGNKKKLKFILFGGALLFAINIIRLVTTVAAAYSFGFQYLEVMHTFLWREGLIFALLALWFLWLRKQKNNISQSQTILRTLYSLIRKKR